MHGTGGRTPADGAETAPGTGTVGNVEHYSCGVASLLATGAFVVLLYSSLVALTEALGILATTWLVLAVFAFWFATWLLLEVAWEWRAGRLTVRQ